MRYLILLIFPVMALFGSELTLQSEAVLEDFFKVLCMESEGGYVLYGKKPVCINGFYVQDNFGGPCEAHRNSVFLKEGATLWKRIGQNDGNLIIHVYDQPDSLATNYIHVLFLNKELFYKTVHENLTLFQYVLGPNLTPESLLKELLDPKQTFHEVLKDDKVLIGILLGFGTENALHVSRIENLQDAYVNGTENIPYKNQFQSLNGLLGGYRDVFLNQLKQNAKVIKQKPSFSYKTFEDEIIGATNKIELSSAKLSKNKPRFIFGKLKNSSAPLIAELENTQDDIIQLCSSPDFLKKTLTMIYPGKEIVFENETIPGDKLLMAISAHLYDSVREENESYFAGFIKGLQDADQNRKFHIEPFDHYEKLKVLKAAKENVAIADQLFADLERKGFIPVGKGAAYKISKQGHGRFLNDQAVVMASYKIKMPNGEVLKEEQSERIDLKETIPGFAWGMKGMQEGEIREIYIHPSAAYGLYTNLEKGIYLSAEVELLSIESSDAIPFSPMAYLDFSPAFNFLSQSNFDEISRNEGYLLGLEIGSHYKKQSFFTLEKLIEAIQKKPEYPANSDLVNKLHWHIYHN